MAKPRPGRRAGALLALVAAAVLTGCATAPSDNVPRSLSGQGNQQQAYVQPLPPPPPTPAWNAEQVVLAFLAANASFELDPSAARQYLANPKQWNPSGAVVVVSPNLTVKPLNIPRAVGQPTAFSKVTLRGTFLATLTNSGQYRYQGAGTTYHLTFVLVKQNGVYKIQSPPEGSNRLLLTRTAFDQVFQPRNLYFFGRPHGSTTHLVPDPVFAPVQSPTVANTTGLARELVQGLFPENVSSSSWLTGATTTAFPARTRLIAVTISGQTAVVDLGGAAAQASPGRLARMLAQVSETLMSPSYSAPLVQHVKLATNGRLRHLPPFPHVVPAVGGTKPGPLPLYFATPGQVYQQTYPSAAKLVLAPGPRLAGQEITALAVRAGVPRLAVAVGGTGCTVYESVAGSARVDSSYQLGSSHGECTSLSWGAGGSLWAVAGSRVWLLQSGHVQQVGLPTSSLIPRGTQVQGLTVAPDGIRVALLVRTGSQRRLLLGAPGEDPVTGNMQLKVVPVGGGLVNPTAVTWYKPDELLALGGTEQLYGVPLTGGQPTLLGSVPASTSIATTGSFVALRAANVISTSSGPSGPWKRVKAPPVLGPASPVFPG